jgi:hypothetical protein
VREKGTGRELDRQERSFTPDVGQDVLPERPLTIGPGYTPNPDAGSERAK